MKQVGHRKERKITFNATQENLSESSEFNDSINRFFKTRISIPKGVYHYKNHREANDALEKYIVKSIIDRVSDKTK